jgi:hypothetical protein
MVPFYWVRPSRVVHRQRFWQGVIRATFTLGDSICGIIQQAVQRLVPECRDVRLCLKPGCCQIITRCSGTPKNRIRHLRIARLWLLYRS